MTNVDATLVEHIFEVRQRQRESDTRHHRKADDLRRGVEILERVGVGIHLSRCLSSAK